MLPGIVLCCLDRKIAGFCDVKCFKVAVFHRDPRIAESLPHRFTVTCENPLFLRFGADKAEGGQIGIGFKARMTAIGAFNDRQRLFFGLYRRLHCYQQAVRTT